MREEHILYFTPETFLRSFGILKMPVSTFISYPYLLENSLVAIVRPHLNGQTSVPAQPILDEEIDRITEYTRAFPQHLEEYQNCLSDFRQNKGKIALWGAGHIACSFVNFLGLKPYIEFVVDDNPKKLGLHMPGSGLPIVKSNDLISEDIKLCLLTVHPQLESVIIEKNKTFIEHGGTFASIFPCSDMSLNS